MLPPMSDDAGGPVPLLELIDWAQEGSAEAFAARVGGWALVGPPLSLDGDDWSYRTLSARSVRDETEDGDVVILRDSYAAYPLKKSRPGPFADTILIGRSSSNDVRLPHTSVSKLHARVRYGADGRPLISDAGSSNGTHVQEERLESGWRPLASGDVVQLGSCSFRLLEPRRLYLMVRKFSG